ncbi:MAG: disulfide oxidoreductase [Acidobacteriota bacterium]|nr:disulfide oxidoreductase [Acidobacteriota bacterium]
MENSEPVKKIQERKSSDALPYAAWIIALIATVGSLFFSEVMQLPPCVLCWYQRIAMYPLVLVIGAGILMRDGSRMKYYALPLALVGLAISIYHNLLYYGILPESITPCTQGVSCTSRQIEWLGFITIPLMALTAFIGVSLCLWLYKTEKRKTTEETKK